MARNRDESALVHAIRAKLGARPDCLVLRITVGPVVNPATGAMVGPSAPAGTADLLVCYRGRWVSLEVKSSTGRQSEAQAGHQRGVERAGGIYEVIRSLEDVEKVLASVRACVYKW